MTPERTRRSSDGFSEDLLLHLIRVRDSTKVLRRRNEEDDEFDVGRAREQTGKTHPELAETRR